MPKESNSAVFAPRAFAAAAVIALGLGAAPAFAQDTDTAAAPKCSDSDIALMESKAAPMPEGDTKSKALSSLERAKEAMAAKDMTACSGHMQAAMTTMTPAK